MDLQQKQKEFANVFAHVGECEKMNNEKKEKIALINEVAETLNELKIESKEFLEEIESEKYSISFEIDEQISKAEDSNTKESKYSKNLTNVTKKEIFIENVKLLKEGTSQETSAKI